MTSNTVKLYVYDLSQGFARMMGPQFGLQIDGIWHTSVVVFGKEYYFSQGIFVSEPGTTSHGQPLKVVDMGTTEVTLDIFEDFLESNKSDWTADKYHILDHNCNNFSDVVCEFLVGKNIPSYITSLPNDFRKSPAAALFMPYIERMYGVSQTEASNGGSVAPLTGAANPINSLSTELVQNIMNLTQSTSGTAFGGTNSTSTTTPPQQVQPKEQAHVHKTKKIETLKSFSKTPIEFTQFTNVKAIANKAVSLIESFVKDGKLDGNTAKRYTDLVTDAEAAISSTKPIDDVERIVSGLFSETADIATKCGPANVFPLVDLSRILSTVSYKDYLTNKFRAKEVVSLVVKLLEILMKASTNDKLSADAFPNTWLMILRLSTNLFAKKIPRDLIMSVSEKTSFDTVFRSAFTAALIEGLLATSINVRQAAASLLFNVSLIVAENRSKGSEGSGLDKESLIYSVEWESEIIAAVGKHIESISEGLPSFEKPQAKQDFVDSLIRMLVGLGNVIYFAPDDVLELASALSINTHIATIAKLVKTAGLDTSGTVTALATELEGLIA